MKELRILLDLCLFQAKPQDFPYSQTWLLIAAIVLSVGIFVSNPFQEQPSSVVVMSSIVHVLGYGFSIWAVLRMREISERSVQTITTILGTSAVLQLVAWPFVNWWIKVRDTPDALFPTLAIYIVGIWTFAIAVNINRHAMEITIGQSILITLGIQLFTASIVFVLFGVLL